MGDDRGESGGARELLVRYLRQMKELGETEVYLSHDVRERVLAGRTPERTARGPAAATVGADGSSGRVAVPRHAASTRPGGDGPRGSDRQTQSPVSATREAEPANAGRVPARASGASGARPSPAELAASMPEPEIVEATLAVTSGPSTSDMFVEASALDGCSSLEELEKLALACEKCELSQGRTKVVFGAGNPNATLMFVGEAPGRDEDLSGIPFVGRSGQLLDKILAAADIARDSVYIGNIIKCRPPNNRTPLTNEVDACMPYLAKQLQYIKPSIICTLGLPATQTLLGLRDSMRSMRGKLYKAGDIVVVPTYHPAAALRDPRYKKPMWEDFLIVKREYDRARGAA